MDAQTPPSDGKSVGHKQRPLGTGFSAASTAEDVIAGIDLTGKHVVVTGGHGTVGLETSRVLALTGASVTVAARNTQAATAALTAAGVRSAEVSQLDLLDPASIAAFVERWLATRRPLHVLVNNASPMSSAALPRDARGYDAHFATCQLGHFQLTNGLLPALRAAHGARVVNLSSGAQRFGDIRWDDPNFLRDPPTSRQSYMQAKRAVVLHAVELDRRWARDGIRGYAVHPGVIVGPQTPGSAQYDRLRAMGLLDDSGAPVIDPAIGKKTVQQGAATVVFAATSPLLDGVGGVYLKDCDVSRVDDEPRQLTADSIPSEVVSASIDPEDARRLWELSERLLA